MPRSDHTGSDACNKQLALDMWQAVIVDVEPEAVLRYISPDYVQHNPAVPRAAIFCIRRSSNWRTKGRPIPTRRHTPPSG